MRISGCIITKNEQENIAACISSLKPIVDEIIVVDTGSEDDTVRIAEDMGAFVVKQRWEDDFSKAKNYALEKAKGDWIIFLDADEYFTEDMIPKVRPIIEKVHSDRSIDGIGSGITHIDKDTGHLIGSDTTVRIYRNYKKIRYVNKIHEEIRNNGEALRCYDAKAELSVMHTGYSASVQREKARRNLEMLLNSPKNSSTPYYLATTYQILEDYENASKYAEEALLNESLMSWGAAAYKMHLIRISSALKEEPRDKGKVQRLIDEANLRYFNHPEVISMEASYLFDEKEYEKSLEKYLYALDCQDKYGAQFEQNTFLKSIDNVYYAIAQILQLTNRGEEALEHCFNALREERFNEREFKIMFHLIRSEADEEILFFINSIYDIHTKEDMEFVSANTAGSGKPVVELYYKNKYADAVGINNEVK